MLQTLYLAPLGLHELHFQQSPCLPPVFKSFCLNISILPLRASLLVPADASAIAMSALALRLVWNEAAIALVAACKGSSID
jgi:hypothetical protein